MKLTENHHQQKNEILIFYTSKKSFDLLKSLYKKRHGNLANFSAYIKDTSHSNAVYDNIRNINFLSNYKDKIVILGLHKSSCSACLKLLLVLRKLEKKFSLNENVIFINLFSENEHNFGLPPKKRTH